MDYSCRLVMTKALTQVVCHIEVTRHQGMFPQEIIMWQRTELLDEEAHPEPDKWAINHIMAFLQSMG